MQLEKPLSASPPVKPTENDYSLQVGSMAQVNVKGKPLYGVIKWKGYHENFPTVLMAGLELVGLLAFCNTMWIDVLLYLSCPVQAVMQLLEFLTSIQLTKKNLFTGK